MMADMAYRHGRVARHGARLVRRAVAYAAATVMIGAVGAVLLQLLAQILSLPAPLEVTAFTLIAATLLHSLRRRIRARAGHRYGVIRSDAAHGKIS